MSTVGSCCLCSGMLAADVARTSHMKQLLDVRPKKDAVKVPARFEGLLIRVGYNTSIAI